MGGDAQGWEFQDARAPPGVPLVEVAFGDRVKYFELEKKRLVDIVRRQADAMFGTNRPNYGPSPGEKDDSFVHSVPTDPSISVSGKGPDGFGEDQRIKNPAQLKTCLAELVESLTNFEAFRWDTYVLSVPEAVMQALEKKKLLHLWYNVYAQNPPSDDRRAPNAFPMAHSYWRCAKDLISIHIKEPRTYRNPVPVGPIAEIHEEDFWKKGEHSIIERSGLEHLDFQFMQNDRHAQAMRKMWQTQRKHNARTVITAAKGGNLRFLFFWSQDEVFAIRSLVPAWVSIFRWNSQNGHMYGDYLKAAASLLSCLSHFARWHNGAGSTDRHLTPA